MREVKTGKIFWGIFLLLAAVFLIVSQMGLVEGVSIMGVLFSIFWASQLIVGLVKLSFGRILFSLAFLAIIFDKPLGIEAITPWTVLAAALLGTIGLNMIFRKKRKGYYHYETDWRSWDKYQDCREGQKFLADGEMTGGEMEGEMENRSFQVQTTFGSAVKYIQTDHFEYAYLNCDFGSAKIYFDNAVISNGRAEIYIQANFSSVELYVPREWKVVDETRNAFGSVDEKNQSYTEGYPEVVLTGSVSFGSVEIIYI